jgi:hypothetical protein
MVLQLLLTTELIRNSLEVSTVPSEIATLFVVFLGVWLQLWWVTSKRTQGSLGSELESDGVAMYC